MVDIFLINLTQIEKTVSICKIAIPQGNLKLKLTSEIRSRSRLSGVHNRIVYHEKRVNKFQDFFQKKSLRHKCSLRSTLENTLKSR